MQRMYERRDAKTKPNYDETERKKNKNGQVYKGPQDHAIPSSVSYSLARDYHPTEEICFLIAPHFVDYSSNRTPTGSQEARALPSLRTAWEMYQAPECIR